MSLMNVAKKLMGVSYSEIDTVPADVPPPSTFVRQCSLDTPSPELAREEEMISVIRRSAEVEDVPVFQSTDPQVAQASFRGRSIPPHAPETQVWGATSRPKDEEARRRSVLSLGSTNDWTVHQQAPPAPSSSIPEKLSPRERGARLASPDGWVDDRDFPIVSREVA
jgi:hypothetical protein